MPQPSGDPLSWARSWATEGPTDLALAGPGLALTASELWDTALRISVGLAQAGVMPGEIVALAGPPVLRPVLTLGALARGALAVGYPAGDGARVVAFDSLSGLPAERLVRLDLADLASQPDPSGADHPGMTVARGAPALLVSSSGATGIPKSVVFTTEQLVRRVTAARATWIPEGREFASLLGPGSMSGQLAFLAALGRRKVHLVPGSPEQSLVAVHEYGIHTVKGSPTQLAELLGAARGAGQRLPELEVAEAAGSPIPRVLAAELAAWFGIRVSSLYGATEVGTVAVVDDATLRTAARLLPDADVEIVDDRGIAVPDGRPGQVRIRTSGIASGYLEHGGIVEFAGGWFRPGDVGRIEHGELTLLGRGDDLLNAAGVKVAPELIEQLARELPGVDDAGAAAVVDARGVGQIALAVVGEPVGDPSAFVARLASQLGDATPRIIVRLASIPRTESGKVLRAELGRAIAGMLGAGIDPE